MKCLQDKSLHTTMYIANKADSGLQSLEQLINIALAFASAIRND